MSRVSFVDPENLEKISEISFENENYHILTANICQFKEIQGESFLLISVAEKHSIVKNTF